VRGVAARRHPTDAQRPNHHVTSPHPRQGESNESQCQPFDNHYQSLGHVDVWHRWRSCRRQSRAARGESWRPNIVLEDVGRRVCLSKGSPAYRPAATRIALSARIPPLPSESTLDGVMAAGVAPHGSGTPSVNKVGRASDKHPPAAHVEALQRTRQLRRTSTGSLSLSRSLRLRSSPSLGDNAL